MFLITSMPVGGAETLLVNLIRKLDRSQFLPELVCLKELGPLGEVLAAEVPSYANLLSHKTDWRVLPRLTKIFRSRRADAVVTVGAGDKMFWGRLAAWRAGVPVVASALHSTGWPDGVGRLNRLLTPITDAFVAVAAAHGRFLVEFERFPERKVFVIPNGVDTDRFRCDGQRNAVRARLGLDPAMPVAGIVAALRPEKNHELFLQAAAAVREHLPQATFLIIGDGPERSRLEDISQQLGLGDAVRFLGTRHDIPQLLAALDVFALTSRMEANPVSILEAMATGLPVVAPDVGSIAESVIHGRTGFLTAEGNLQQVSERLIELLGQPQIARAMGQSGRQAVVDRWSLDGMVRGYEQMINQIYAAKCQPQGQAAQSAKPIEAEV